MSKKKQQQQAEPLFYILCMFKAYTERSEVNTTKGPKKQKVKSFYYSASGFTDDAAFYPEKEANELLARARAYTSINSTLKKKD